MKRKSAHSFSADEGNPIIEYTAGGEGWIGQSLVPLRADFGGTLKMGCIAPATNTGFATQLRKTT
jgi:hypothetical protein